MSDRIETVVAEMLPGDVVTGWDEGDPFRATVKRVVPRPVQTVRTGPVQWVYDVEYAHGHTSYSQDGDSPRRVIRGAVA